MNERGIQESGKVRKAKRRRNFSEHDENRKKRRKSKPKNEERSRQILFIFSWKKASARLCKKREVEALRSNSIE